MSRPTINSIWIGPKLGPVHAACLRSFVRHGHRTVLHVYERPTGVPEGVELSDANELLPASRIIRHSATGSLALHSDFLRYEILRRNLGVYVDTDMLCLRPLEDADYVFGFESTDFINGAVLKLPPGCPALDELVKIKDMRALIPSWASPRRRRYYRWRARLGVPVKIQDMPWGSVGPRALTWYLKQYGLDRHAAPIDVFYPVHYGQIPLLLDPDLTIGDITTPRTCLLHLWNENLRKMDLSRTPATSPLGRVLASSAHESRRSAAI